MFVQTIFVDVNKCRKQLYKSNNLDFCDNVEFLDCLIRTVFKVMFESRNLIGFLSQSNLIGAANLSIRFYLHGSGNNFWAVIGL